MRREKVMYMVFAFHTTTSAFALERYSKNMGIEGRLITVPRQISAGCGTAFRMTVPEFEKLPGLTGHSELSPTECWWSEINSRNIEVESITPLEMR